MIKVLVVDDSAFMRKAISTMLEKDSMIKVVDTARNGQEAIEKVQKLNPDVVTLDIEMPKMDGLTALRHIMMSYPRPVLMISSLTTEGAEATLKAMELGAVDFIPKSLSKISLDIVKIEKDLQNKVKVIAGRKFRPVRPGRTAAASTGQKVFKAPPKGAVPVRDLVAIGVSTGGPPAVQKVLQGLPGDLQACILIAQHMPPAFTGPFAKRLDALSKLSVKEAEKGDKIKNGMVYIAPGGQQLKVVQKGSMIDLEVSKDSGDAIYKPSANVLISSVAACMGKKALGVILTGMGNDGLEGIRKLKQKGGRVLAQNDASCVVYGMPKAVIDAGLADEVVDIQDMSQALLASLY